MTTDFNAIAPAAKTGRLKAVFRAVAWGPAVGGIIVGIVLGTSYSFFTRLAAAPPVELAASVDERPVTGTPAIFATAAPAATPLAKPADATDLRDVALRPIPRLGAEPPSGFRSIATLSAPSSRLETEVRGLKGEPAPASVERADAVAAVWGFLAVGLGGTTASAAGTPRSSIKQPR